MTRVTLTDSDDTWRKGTNADETVFALDGADLIWTAGGDDLIYASGRSRSVASDGAVDTLKGGTGNDTFYNLDKGDKVRGGEGLDTALYALQKAAKGVKINPFKLFDPVRGVEAVGGRFTPFDDTVTVGYGMAGANGGGGTDRYIMDFREPFGKTGGLFTAEVFATRTTLDFSTSGATQTVDLTLLGAQSFTVTNFERFQVHGSSGRDAITGGNLGDKFIGLNGNDTLIGGKGRDTLKGGVGDDCLVGGEGRDTLDGGDGDDLIYLADVPGGAPDAAARDKATGGDGYDTFVGADGQDAIRGGRNIDTVLFDLRAQDEGVRIQPGRLFDGFSSIEQVGGMLTQGDDTLVAGYSVTDADGQGGNDLIRLDYRREALQFTEGNMFSEVIFDGRSADGTNLRVPYSADLNEAFTRVAIHGFERLHMIGTEGRDEITGLAGQNTILGGAGNDEIEGQGGADRLFGQGDNDTLVGGGGKDTIEGGPGNDRLVLGAYDTERAAGNALGGAGNDVITLNGASGGRVKGGTGYDILIIDEERAADGVKFGFQSFINNEAQPIAGVKGATGFELLLGELGSGDDEIWLTAPVALDLGRPTLFDRGAGDRDLLVIDFSSEAIDRTEPATGIIGVTITRNEIIPRYERGEITNPIDYRGFEQTRLIGTPGDDILYTTGTFTYEYGDLPGAAIGGAGDDVLIASSGRAEFDGGPGTDLIFGGGLGVNPTTGEPFGVNTYHYNAGNEVDAIIRLQARDGLGDKVVIDRDLWSGLESLAAMLDDHLTTYRGPDIYNAVQDMNVSFSGSAALDFGGGDLLIFYDWTEAEIRAQGADFLERETLFF